MRTIWYGALSIGCVAGAIFAGCGDQPESPTGPTSTSTSGSGGGTTGTGGAGGCKADSECPASTIDCKIPSCGAGVCSLIDAMMGTPSATQTAGDCKKHVCDGTGSTTLTDDDTDVPTPSTTCVTPSCAAGMPVLTPVSSGMACTDSNGHFCDGAGKCVECVMSSQCTSGVCQTNACVPATCIDTIKNGNETDVDCGGSCGACVDGKACLAGKDCQSKVCTGGVCQVPTCTDAVKNGSESDVDCGGPTCPKCPNGDTCLSASECVSGICAGTPLTCQPPSCTDGLQNQGEVDVDCAGPCTKLCAPGKKCGTGADCAGGLCDATAHTCTPTCTDGVKNNAETDVDCGGGACGACGLGKACAQPSDCASTICTGGVCSQINGCDPVTALDKTGQANVAIAFGGALGDAYSPPCIKVSVGTKVTFNGDFSFHPFSGGTVVNGTPTPATTGPFATEVLSGMTKTFTMSSAGSFAYFCEFHGPFGMYGAVFVQ